MKSTTTNSGLGERLFPKMMQHSCGIIVLFHKQAHGTVVYSNDLDRPVGTYKENWSNVDSPSFWSDYTGTVNISND